LSYLADTQTIKHKTKTGKNITFLAEVKISSFRSTVNYIAKAVAH